MDTPNTKTMTNREFLDHYWTMDERLRMVSPPAQLTMEMAIRLENCLDWDTELQEEKS